MKVANIIETLEQIAHPSLQESYDNCGLLTGHPNQQLTGVLTTLDVMEEVVDEAIRLQCNLIVAHHPIIFGGLKRLTGENYIQKAVIKAIKNDIAIYAFHTSLDNVLWGVSKTFSDKFQLQQVQPLQTKKNQLFKLFTYVPVSHVQQVRTALYTAGAGEIGEYAQCSFSSMGTGTFLPKQGTNPFIGDEGQLQEVQEAKLEVIFPKYLANKVVKALLQAHPYEEVAYDIIQTENEWPKMGSGIVGTLPNPITEQQLLQQLSSLFNLQVVRHTKLLGKPIQNIAFCGGSGSFLTKQAIAKQADCYITSDIKYHEFFDAEDKLLLVDIGHAESEQFVSELISNVLQTKFPTFAVLKSKVVTNPVHYWIK